MYENQGVCTKIKISHMEGFCNSWSDPYRGAVDTNKVCVDDYDILKAFKNFWNENRKEVRRDTAHLFYGRDLEGTTIGCAYVGTLCKNSYGYGVNQLTYSGDLNQRASVFAHELAHNIGLEHVNEEGKIMSANVTAGDLTWTSSSIRSIQKELSNVACVRKHCTSDPLYAIQKRGTGSKSTEIHVLSNRNCYQGFFLQTRTALHETGDNFEFALAPNRDLYAIKKTGTGSKSTEIHILSKKSNYQRFSLQTGTALHETGDDFEFALAPNLDLYAIKKRGTGSKFTEIHILSRRYRYQRFSLQTDTALGETNDNYEFAVATNIDLPFHFGHK